jgi:hypothetical protein
VRAGRWLPVLGVLAVAACASPPPPPPAVAAAPPPDRIDGRYRGIARLTVANIRGCPRSGSHVVTVEGNALSLQYRGERASYALAATVGSDGSVHGSDGRGKIEGQISGRHMDLTVSSPYCEVRYALDHR